MKTDREGLDTQETMGPPTSREAAANDKSMSAPLSVPGGAAMMAYKLLQRRRASAATASRAAHGKLEAVAQQLASVTGAASKSPLAGRSDGAMSDVDHPSNTPGAPSAANATDPDEVRRVAMDITGIFESGGGYGALNDYDSGIISFGRHQATLASGALERVLTAYLSASTSEAATSLSSYMDRVRRKDPELRGDETFKGLLRSAATEAAMQRAEDEVAAGGHYDPAVRRASQQNVSTPLGIAMLYDTNNQGGLGDVLSATVARLGGTVGENQITELQFLVAFNDERRQRLLRLAELRRSQGRDADARALANSVYRCDEFDRLLSAGNLQLSGDFVIRGQQVTGIGGGSGDGGAAGTHQATDAGEQHKAVHEKGGGAEAKAKPAAANGHSFTREAFLRMLMPCTNENGTVEGLLADAQAHGLIQSKAIGEARPNDPLTRAEAAVILTRWASLAGEAIEGAVAYFFDVPRTQWYFTAAHVCRLFGIFSGTRENLFLPDQLVDAATAKLLLMRAGTRQRLPIEKQQAEGSTVKAPTSPTSLYPGKSGSAAAKYGWYRQVLGDLGHGSDVATEPGQYSMVGIRGLSPDGLTAMKYDNAPFVYNDTLVVLGLDASGTPVVREYLGSTDPGRAGSTEDFGGEVWQMEPGVWEYQYDGKHRHGGDKFRMTGVAAGADHDWYANRDVDRDGVFGEDGEREAQKGGRSFLIHRGGKDPGKEVGAWSVGCQVIPGTDSDGTLLMDQAGALLKKNAGQKFKYILVDGQRILEVLGRSA